MLNRLFGTHGAKNQLTSAAEGNGAEHADSSERKEPVSPTIPIHDCPASFEQIYQSAAVRPPKLAYGISKVAEMAGSPHLAGLPADHKRKALLMALDAADTSVGDVLNDVVLRQRALKEFEDALQEKIKVFEAEQSERNRLDQQELDRITSQHKTRIQGRLDQVARAHEEFCTWQMIKLQESQRLSDIAALCVSPNKEQQDSDNVIRRGPQSDRRQGTHDERDRQAVAT